MLNWDFSSYGWLDGVWKLLKVIGWYALSGAIVNLIALAASYHPSEGQYLAVLAIMAANSILAGIQKWLSTCKP